MTIKIGVVMDPIESITPYKDTTFAMLLAAQGRGWKPLVIDQRDIWMRDGEVFAHGREVRVEDNNDHWFDIVEERDIPLATCDIVLMRKDPPFNMDYIYTTYLLERVAQQGTVVSNAPHSLRDVNEKLFTAWFSEHCPTTLVTTQSARLKAFIQELGDVIIKPLDGMGGDGIFRLTPDDPNLNIILEQSTRGDRLQIMAQRYLPEISAGDKRVLVINGKPVPFALARIPSSGETRGNLAAGGRGVPVPLSDENRQLADALSGELVKRGLLFVGLDMIGNKLTEVNVTSPTCVRELDAHMHKIAEEAGQTHRPIAEDYLDALQQRLA